MLIVKVKRETVVYNSVKNRYEVTAISKKKYSFENPEEMVQQMTKKNYEYKSNVYNKQSGWFRVTQVENSKGKGHMAVSTGLIYSIKD